MINLNQLPHSVIAAIGAMLVSTTFIAAAVGPVQAAQPAAQTAQLSTSAQAHA